MGAEIIISDIFLNKAINELITKNTINTTRGSNKKLIITDSKTLLSKRLRITSPICAMLIFIDDTAQEELLKMIPTSYKIIFVKKNSSVDFVINIIKSSLYFIMQNRGCFYKYIIHSSILSQNERGILLLQMQRKSDRAIASVTGHTYKSVQNYRNRAMRKVGVRPCVNWNVFCSFYYDFIYFNFLYQQFLDDSPCRNSCNFRFETIELK